MLTPGRPGKGAWESLLEFEWRSFHPRPRLDVQFSVGLGALICLD